MITLFVILGSVEPHNILKHCTRKFTLYKM